MARTAREKSETGIYHIMLRGIDKRNIFLKDSDYEKFTEYIKKAKEKTAFTVFAYCLMPNHVHMLLKVETEEVGDVVRRITVGYAQYHNIKNGRTGHLFQNRFKSEPVNTDEYFLVVLRYIHQNPIKAGLVEKIEDYKWSSYNAYINKDTLINTTFALNYFKGIQGFIAFTLEETEDQCLKYNPKKRYTDEELEETISLLVDKSLLHTLDIASRNNILKSIKETTGASNRQLSRILKIGRGILDKI
ncbi:REP-associated tyrosine transposase [Candidatus Contubernalis alkaliaceticus]|uniref:REP-associated tyrosine transposase n=1 Tax=Candidatus Contubernalis alkaliaceticus TaxID=338645 RepID=UPI001F4BF7DD|nr:transposase [Candidatus Contubernalis alkalaceticus]UNC90641.1 transposase [Candidatus Contubernalis alkalaceticus]